MTTNYDYKCMECGYVFEMRFQSYLQRTLAEICPACCGNARRVYHPKLIKYSGSGWTRQVQEPDDDLI